MAVDVACRCCRASVARGSRLEARGARCTRAAGVARVAPGGCGTLHSNIDASLRRRTPPQLRTVRQHHTPCINALVCCVRPSLAATRHTPVASPDGVRVVSSLRTYAFVFLRFFNPRRFDLNFFFFSSRFLPARRVFRTRGFSIYTPLLQVFGAVAVPLVPVGTERVVSELTVLPWLSDITRAQPWASQGGAEGGRYSNQGRSPNSDPCVSFALSA